MKKNILLFILLLSGLSTSIFGQTEIEPNNDYDNSNIFSLPASIVADMGTATDEDWFRVNVSSFGVLLVNFTGANSQLRGRVEVWRVANGNVVKEATRDATLSGDDVNMELLIQSTGAHFVRISNLKAGPTGTPTYNLSISLEVDNSEFNNVYNSIPATSTFDVSYNENAPNEIRGKIRGYYRTDYGWSNGHLFGNLTSDQDYYKLKLNGKRGVLVMRLDSVATNLKLQLDVYRSGSTTSEGQRAASANGDSLRFEFLAQYAEDYLVRVADVSGSPNGSNTSPKSYRLKIAFDTSGGEFNNVYNSIPATSTFDVSYNENAPNEIRGKIRGYYRTDYGWSNGHLFGNLTSDQDYYKLKLNGKRGVLVMRLDSVATNLKLQLDVYRSGSTTSEGQRAASANGDSLRFEFLAQYAEDYLVRVADVSGSPNGSNTSPKSYRLKIAFDTSGGEFNNVYNSIPATSTFDVSYNENAPNEIRGKIRGYYRTDYGWSNGHLFGNLTSDQDYYKLKLNGKRGVLVMRLDSVATNLKLQLDVYRSGSTTSEGQRAASANGDSLRFEFLAQYAEDYLVRVADVSGSPNGSNTSPKSYRLKIAFDTSGGEFNNTADNATSIRYNKVWYGKVRGHFRTDYGWSNGHLFGNLTTDVDYYKTDSCGTFEYAKVSKAPNLKLKITAYAANGTTVVGSVTAPLNGDSIILNASSLTGQVRFFKVESTNVGNTGNTSRNTYSLYLGYKPFANITTTVDTACLGTGFNFTSSINPSSNWNWSFGSGAVPPTSSVQNPSSVIFNSTGPRNIILAVPGCKSDTLSINVFPNTPTPTISQDGDVLTSSSTTGNQWYLNNSPISGGTSQTHQVTQNGTYKVCLTIPMSCGNPCSEPYMFTEVSGFQSVDDFFVFPNPTTGLFQISNISHAKALQITDALGREVFAQENPATTIDIPALPKGIYYLYIRTAEGTAVQKLVKE